MRAWSNPKVKHGIQIGAAFILLLALFLLATSLSNLELNPGEVYLTATPKSAQLPTPHPEFDAELLLKIILVAVFSVGIISLIIALSSSKERKPFLRHIGIILFYMVIFIIVMRHYSSTRQPEAATPAAGSPATAMSILPEMTPAPGNPPLAVNPPPPPAWASYLTSFLVVLFVGLAGYGLWRWMQAPHQEMQAIVRSALSDLSAGRSWEDTVIQCYQRMSAAAHQRRGLDRHANMTPREFIATLERDGLPAGPVENLTRLFEKARYGSHKSNPVEATQAIDCLSAIMAALEGRR